jgi:hypothetical protein
MRPGPEILGSNVSRVLSSPQGPSNGRQKHRLDTRPWCALAPQREQQRKLRETEDCPLVPGTYMCSALAGSDAGTDDPGHGYSLYMLRAGCDASSLVVPTRAARKMARRGEEQGAHAPRWMRSDAWIWQMQGGGRGARGDDASWCLGGSPGSPSWGLSWVELDTSNRQGERAVSGAARSRFP